MCLVSTVRCRRASTLWWLSQWRTSWSQHGPGWQRDSCPGSTWAWVSFSATAVYTLTTEARHGRGGGWWTDALMLCCLSLGVFYGGVCIGMAGVASLMGNILQVNPFYTQSKHFKCNTAVLSLKNLSFSLYQRHPLLIRDCNDMLRNPSSTGSFVYIWYDQWTTLGPLYAGHVLPLCELHGKNVHLNVLITTFQVSFCASFSTNNQCLKRAPSNVFHRNCLWTGYFYSSFHSTSTLIGFQGHCHITKVLNALLTINQIKTLSPSFTDMAQG